MDTTASEVGGIFCQVHRAQPLHHTMIGPLLNLRWGDAVLVRRPPPKTVWLEVIDPQDLDGPFDTEMVQHTHNLQGQEVILPPLHGSQE